MCSINQNTLIYGDMCNKMNRIKCHCEKPAIKNNLCKGCGRAENKHRVPVVQMDIDGNEIEHFPSIIEASYTMDIAPIGIRKAIDGRQKTAGGYKWKKYNTKTEI